MKKFYVFYGDFDSYPHYKGFYSLKEAEDFVLKVDGIIIYGEILSSGYEN